MGRPELERVVAMVRGRPRLSLMVAVGAAVVLGATAVSCQSLGGGASRASAPRRASRPMFAAEPDVRVRIVAGAPSVEIDGPEALSLRPDGSSPLRLRAPLIVSAREDGLRVRDASGAVHAPGPVAELAPAGGPGEPVVVNGAAYAGRLRLVARRGAEPMPVPAGGVDARAVDVAWPDQSAGARLDVVEIVPLETYLAGVLVKELPHSWPLAAFHVQAVCARTYALHQRERAQRLGRPFDLEATVIDQAYAGATDLEVARRALADTRGTVLTWQGELLRAYYSSTCGGRSAAAADIWPTSGEFAFNLAAPIQAYRRDHACEGSPVYTWEVTRTRDDLSRRFREWGKINGSPVKAMGTIAGLEVVRRNAVGRPTVYRVTDLGGKSYTLNAEEVRVACNTAAPGVPAIDGKSRVRSGDLAMVFDGPRVVVRGRGFGHGVGMCQYCARGMAERGDGWREMLGRFYPGAAIERVY